MQKAFTMIELIFVIVVIGILAAVAVPKFSGIAQEAHNSKAKSTIASIRSALATERQKRILRGVFTPITKLDAAADVDYNKVIFNNIDGDTDIAIFDYTMIACKDQNTNACWYTSDGVTYKYKMANGTGVDFNITSSKFICAESPTTNCDLLTR